MTPLETLKMVCLGCKQFGKGGVFYPTTKKGEFSFICCYVFSCPTTKTVNGVLVDEEMKKAYEENHAG